MVSFVNQKLLPCVLSFLLICSLFVTVGAEEAENPPVSCGLRFFACQTDVALCAMAGNEIVFSSDAFARGMNLSCIDYLTVCSLPAVTDGELLLGSSRISEGQVISGGNLSSVAFRAASEDIRRSSFTFCVNGSPTVMTCSLYLLDEPNSAPTLAYATGFSLKNKTYQNLSAYGSLSGYDSDGDELIFEIVSYPKNGSVQLTNRNAGTYVYKPNENYLGTDRFSYVARDRYGNMSASATVSIQVSYAGTSVVYADMEESADCSAAISMTEKNIMSGTRIGDQTYFYPDREVTRGEFLILAMNTVGISSLPDCKNTEFSDDAEIASGIKGYVSAAYRLGYLKGTETVESMCFSPNEPIGSLDAAVILENLLFPQGTQNEIPTSVSDTIPAWAKNAVTDLCAVGILQTQSPDPNATLTRKEVARLLLSVSNFLD